MGPLEEKIRLRILSPQTYLGRQCIRTLFVLSLLLPHSAAGQACIGDCNSDQSVTVDEILVGVNIALGMRQLSECAPFDSDSSGTVTVDELIAALNVALTGCVATEPTSTPTPTPTPTATSIPPSTSTPTRTATATRPPSLGPMLTYVGVTTMAGIAMQPRATNDEGLPVYQRPVGAGFLVVVEARSGTSGAVLGQCNSSYDAFSPALVPDIQILADRPLGEGNPAVCDGPPTSPTGFNCGDRPPNLTPYGGIPAIDPPDFDAGTRAVADALNDFGCRMQFTGASTDACTKTESGNPRFVDTRSTGQFCSAAFVSAGDMLFHRGDTILSVRWRDQNGNVSDVRRIVVRVP